MTAKRRFCMSIVVGLMLVARLSQAQVLTGTLSGTVKDGSGGAGRLAHVGLERCRSECVGLRFQCERESLPAGWHQLYLPMLRRSAAAARRGRHSGGTRRFAWCVS